MLPARDFSSKGELEDQGDRQAEEGQGGHEGHHAGLKLGLQGCSEGDPEVLVQHQEFRMVLLDDRVQASDPVRVRGGTRSSLTQPRFGLICILYL